MLSAPTTYIDLIKAELASQGIKNDRINNFLNISQDQLGEIANFVKELQPSRSASFSAQDINEVAVSSTKIRKALLEGDIKTANLYLGYNYMLSGTVIKGKGLGKEIEFPTANLLIEETYKLIPKQGTGLEPLFIKQIPNLHL